MIEIIACHQGIEAIAPFIAPLEKEYQFWMAWEEKLRIVLISTRRSVKGRNNFKSLLG